LEAQIPIPSPLIKEKTMASTFDLPRRDEVVGEPRTSVSGGVARDEADEAIVSAVSWAAILAGALAAIASTIILLVLGAGIGLSFVSPWYGAGAPVAAVGVAALVWLVIVQWISSGLGGFLAGRLRTKWVRVHAHEIFFRDTAHGFLVWSLVSVAGALLFASATASGVSSVAEGARGGAAATLSHFAQEAGTGNTQGAISDYYVDSLFRSAHPADEGNAGISHAEAMRILARSLHNGQVELAPEDANYLVQMTAARTGLSQQDAEQRVDSVVTQLNDAQQKTQQTADAARKRTAHLSLAIALSMLIGAFIASAAAALGGKIRDEY
jgi:hypothetical protein